jgi:hypothetical protein
MNCRTLKLVMSSPPIARSRILYASPTVFPPLVVVVAAPFFFLAVTWILIRKTGTRGAKIGAIWGLISPGIDEISRNFLIQFTVALPITIYAKFLLLINAPGGSFYNSPFTVFPVLMLIGAMIGLVIEKVYRKFKGRM